MAPVGPPVDHFAEAVKTWSAVVEERTQARVELAKVRQDLTKAMARESAVTKREKELWANIEKLRGE